MATIPTANDTALLILKTLVEDLNCRADQSVPDQALKFAFENRGGQRADIPAGLKHATEQGWLRYDDDKDAFFLTAAGFAQA
jgi:hypothetical protein